MQQTKLPNEHSYLKDILFLSMVLACLFFIMAGSRPLFVPDEGRYAEIAREMVASGDYVTPHLNGIKYFEKPVLFYWLEAVSLHLGGINIWSVRTINLILGIFGCLITYITARKLYDRNIGLLAALVLGTSTLYFVMSHMVSLDLPVTVFLTACLYSFLLGTREPPGFPRRLYLWSAAMFAAFAVLTKGLIGIVFPGIIIFAWIAILNEWRLFSRIYLPSTLLLFLLIAVPWHIIVNLRHPEFFDFYIIEQHFLRYTTPEVGHYQPVWFFIPVLLLALFPWCTFLPGAIAKSFPRSWSLRQLYKTELFLLLWFILIFAFFSFSKSKLIPYILPVLPPLAILIARYLVPAKKNKLGIRIAYFCLFLLGTGIAITTYYYIHHASFLDPARAAFYFNAAAATLFVGTLISCLYSFNHISRAIKTTIITACIFLLFVITGAASIDNRSVLPLVKILQPRLQSQDEVITYNQYFQDLPFYLQRRIIVANWVNELSNGMLHQDTHTWMIDDEEFWQHWHSNKQVYVFTSRAEFAEMKKYNPHEKFYIIATTIDHMLISNHK